MSHTIAVFIVIEKCRLSRYTGLMSTKELVRSILAERSGDAAFVSGEALAARCGISRTSVWKAIQALERDGYCIQAVTKCGYRLISEPDPVDAAVIKSRMEQLGAAPGAVSAFPSIDSTLSESKRAEAAVPAFRRADGSLTLEGAALHRCLIVAGQQTAGRGRMGRTFVSPANSGVYFTLVYAPKGGVTNPALLTAAAALAVARAIDALYGTQAQIKWVNDVFVGGKKVCGILTEGFASFESGRVEAANVGIGINLRPAGSKGFSGDLAKVAGSIYEAAGSTPQAARVSRNELVAHVAAELLNMYDAFDGEGAPAAASDVSAVMAEYKARSFLLGKTVSVNPAAGLTGQSYRAQVVDIDDSAALVVRTESGESRLLHSGEVSLHSYDFAL